MKKETKVEHLKHKVEKALDLVRPYLWKDQGDVRLLRIDKKNRVHIAFLGSCLTCPMSSMTLKNGIEATVKNTVPEISEVRDVNA